MEIKLTAIKHLQKASQAMEGLSRPLMDEFMVSF